MKILVTGFDPFGGEKVNPAYEAVKILPDKILDAEIIKLEIPTIFTESTKAIEKAIEEYSPDVILSIGQAGGRSCINIEKVAINLAEARIPDNGGEQPIGKALREDGETAYFSNLPVKHMVNRIKENNMPAVISYTAGTYVCNSVMYNGLYLVDKKYPNIRVGFIHVPYSSEQAVNHPNQTPFMSVENIAKAIEISIEAIVMYKDDLDINMGTTH